MQPPSFTGSNALEWHKGLHIQKEIRPRKSTYVLPTVKYRYRRGQLNMGANAGARECSCTTIESRRLLNGALQVLVLSTQKSATLADGKGVLHDPTQRCVRNN
jgi:hypothetical protein